MGNRIIYMTMQQHQVAPHHNIISRPSICYQYFTLLLARFPVHCMHMMHHFIIIHAYLPIMPLPRVLYVSMFTLRAHVHACVLKIKIIMLICLLASLKLKMKFDIYFVILSMPPISYDQFIMMFIMP